MDLHVYKIMSFTLNIIRLAFFWININLNIVEETTLLQRVSVMPIAKSFIKKKNCF